MTRTKKIQSRSKVSGIVGYRKTKILPALELAGEWFQAAGFTPGQMVKIDVSSGLLTIRPA